MTVQEMHLGLDLILQRANSNLFRNLQPEEKDIFLNAEVNRFIRTRCNIKSDPKFIGFSGNEVRLEDIEELLTTVEVPLNTVGSFGELNALLPFNNILVASVEAKGYGNSCADFTNQATSSRSIYKVEVPFKIDTTSPYYSNLIITLTDGSGTTTLFDIGNFSGQTLKASKDYILLIDLMIEEMNKKGVEVRWEKRGVDFTNFTFIITRNTAFTKVTLGLNAINTDYNSSVESVSSFTTNSNYTSKWYPTRITKSNKLAWLKNFSFGGLKLERSLVTIKNGLIYAFHNENFIFTHLRIVYIRKPQRINLALNRACELREDFHEEIVESCAARLASILNTPNRNLLIEEALKAE